jgi:hypothetical protein
MVPTSVNAVAILLLFFVPGFVAEWTYERFIFCPAKSDFHKLLSSLLLSGLLWVVAGPLIYLDWRARGNVWRTYAITAAVVLVGAPLLGWTGARLRLPTRRLYARLQKVKRLEKLLRLHALDGHPTAWDAVFSNRGGHWVIVHTMDGERHYGVYGSASYAGFSPHGRDLFLEHLWWPDSDGGFMVDGERQSGAYFPAEQIKYIEFPPRQLEGE